MDYGDAGGLHYRLWRKREPSLNAQATIYSCLWLKLDSIVILIVTITFY